MHAGKGIHVIFDVLFSGAGGGGGGGINQVKNRRSIPDLIDREVLIVK